MEGDLDLTTSTGLPTPSGNDNPLTTNKYHVSSDYEENVRQTKANEEEKLYNFNTCNDVHSVYDSEGNTYSEVCRAFEDATIRTAKVMNLSVIPAAFQSYCGTRLEYPLVNNIHDLPEVVVTPYCVSTNLPSEVLSIDKDLCSTQDVLSLLRQFCNSGLSGPKKTSPEALKQPVNKTRKETTKELKKKVSFSPRRKRDYGSRLFEPHIREVLINWISTHAEHPYCNKEEKKKLAQITGLDMKQITMWFINYRRRYCKNSENQCNHGNSKKK